MALLKFSEVKKMNSKQAEEKLKDLEFELTKSYVTANKANAKTKEIKRAIARLKTYISRFVPRNANLDDAQEPQNRKKVLDTFSKSVKEELKK